MILLGAVKKFRDFDPNRMCKVFTYFIYGNTLCIVQCFVEGKCYLTDFSSEITEASLAIDALYYQKKSFQYFKKAYLVKFQR